MQPFLIRRRKAPTHDFVRYACHACGAVSTVCVPKTVHQVRCRAPRMLGIECNTLHTITFDERHDRPVMR